MPLRWTLAADCDVIVHLVSHSLSFLSVDFNLRIWWSHNFLDPMRVATLGLLFISTVYGATIRDCKTCLASGRGWCPIRRLATTPSSPFLSNKATQKIHETNITILPPYLCDWIQKVWWVWEQGVQRWRDWHWSARYAYSNQRYYICEVKLTCIDSYKPMGLSLSWLLFRLISLIYISTLRLSPSLQLKSHHF